jgi:hypothetical protein
VSAKALTEAPTEAIPLPPDPEAEGTDGDWGDVADEFRANLVTVNALAAQARAKGQTPQAFRQRVLDAIRTAGLPQNARVLTKPYGAVASFLRNGEWPVPGVVTLEQVAAKEASVAAYKRDRQEQARKQAQSDAADALLEKIYGWVLDGMTDAEVYELAGRGTPLAQAYRSSPGFVRPLLLRKLQDRTEVAHA